MERGTGKSVEKGSTAVPPEGYQLLPARLLDNRKRRAIPDDCGSATRIGTRSNFLECRLRRSIRSTSTSFNSIAYADDLRLLVFAKTAGELEGTINHYLAFISSWINRHSLTMVPEKCEAVMLLKKRLINTPDFELRGYRTEVKKF